MGFVPETIAGSFDLYGSCVHLLLFRYWPCRPLTRGAVGWLLFPMAGTAILFCIGKSFSLLRRDNTKAAFVLQEKVLEIFIYVRGKSSANARRLAVIVSVCLTSAARKNVE